MSWLWSMVSSLKVMGLKEILAEFIKHRQGVIRRRTEFELRKAKDELIYWKV